MMSCCKDYKKGGKDDDFGPVPWCIVKMTSYNGYQNILIASVFVLHSNLQDSPICI